MALSKIFGDYPDVKILECFADNYETPLSISDIVYITELPQDTVYGTIEKLLEKEIVKKIKHGKTQ